jgi:hypothetical protein
MKGGHGCDSCIIGQRPGSANKSPFHAQSIETPFLFWSAPPCCDVNPGNNESKTVLGVTRPHISTNVNTNGISVYSTEAYLSSCS